MQIVILREKDLTIVLYTVGRVEDKSEESLLTGA